MDILYYYKGDRIEEFTAQIRYRLDSDSSAYLVMEPGDGTHYELICSMLPNGRIAWSKIDDLGGWVCSVGKCPEHISYFLEKAGRHANTWTVYMVCELHNLLYCKDVTFPCYYNFAEAQAIIGVEQ